MGFVHLVFTKQMFFRFSFFYLSLLFLFLVVDFWRAGVQSKMMRLTWLNLMWNSISLVFKVLWSLYCTVVMCILFGEMNLLLEAFECSFLPNEQRSFIFIYLKSTPFYFDCKSFCLITPIPQRNALLLWGYDYSRVQIVFSTSAWFVLGSNCSCCTFVTRIANLCFYNWLCLCGLMCFCCHVVLFLFFVFIIMSFLNVWKTSFSNRTLWEEDLLRMFFQSHLLLANEGYQ